MSEFRADVTGLLHSWSRGDSAALDRIVPLVLSELRRTARNLMRRENVNLTLQPTALVNELWLRLATGNPDIDWQDRSHFFAICTRMMQKTLIDFGRRRSTEKRGAGLRFVPAEKYDPGEASSFPDLVALELALEKLARHDPRKAKVFELRFWGGLEVGEIAEVLEVSAASIARDWRFVKAFLKKELFPDFATQSASESD